MNCQEIQQVILEGLDGNQPEAILPALQAHLNSCSDCRAAQADFLSLHARIRDHSLPDPGEVFFQRQLRSIEGKLRETQARRPAWRRWWVPTLAAAAILVVFIGYSTFLRNPAGDWRGQWPTALSWLAQEAPDEGAWLELEDLDEAQLAAYARTVELQLLSANGEGDPEDAVDLQDLDGQEMELLIQRLQAGMGGKTS